MPILSSTVDRRTRIAGIVGSMLVAAVLTSGAVAAADPSPAPEPGTIGVVTTDGTDQAQGGPIVVTSGIAQAMPAYGVDMAGRCGTLQTVTQARRTAPSGWRSRVRTPAVAPARSCWAPRVPSAAPA